MTDAIISRAAAVAALTALLLPGCGGPRMVTVQGQVTQDGKPLQASDKVMVTITFGPVDDKVGQTYPARFVHADASYTVMVPPGKYRAALLVVEPGAAPRSFPASQVYDVSSNQRIDLELKRFSDPQE